MLLGRITKGIGGLYFVDVENTVYKCSVRGIFRKNKIIPTVGDYVKISVLDCKKGVIEEILERKNILIRPRVSNIDCAIITFSVHSPDINRNLLDRFLILAESQNIENIVICINKSELANEKEIKDLICIYKKIYDLAFVSVINNTGIENLKNIIDNKVTVFAGPSGVGKSSIINKIIPEAELKTGEISKKIERGKHTTRQVELLKLWENTYIADSPGFTNLALDFIDESDIGYYFKEFRPFLEKCRFQNCMHLNEPDCGVKENLNTEISLERYKVYTKLLYEINERNDYL